MGAKDNLTVDQARPNNALPIFVDDNSAAEDVFDMTERRIESYYEGLEDIDKYLRPGDDNFHVDHIKERNRQLWQVRRGQKLSFLESKQHNQVLYCSTQHNVGMQLAGDKTPVIFKNQENGPTSSPLDVL